MSSSTQLTLQGRRSTSRITLRLYNDILNDLKRRAEEKDIPLNALITSILTKEMIFEKHVNTMQYIITPASFFAKTIQNLGEKQFEELSKEGPKLVRRSFSIHGISYTFKDVVDEYFIPLGKYCGWFKFSCNCRDRHCRLVFEANMGTAWIRFLTGYLRNILSSLEVYVENESVNDNIIVFEVRMPAGSSNGI